MARIGVSKYQGKNSTEEWSREVVAYDEQKRPLKPPAARVSVDSELLRDSITCRGSGRLSGFWKSKP